MFFKKVDQIVLTEHRIRSIQSLLHEYRQIGREYVFDMVKLKFPHVKKA